MTLTTLAFVNRNHSRLVVTFLCIGPLLINPFCEVVLAQAGIVGDCGSLANGYGPFDYTDPADRRDSLPIVEDNHLDENVRSLRRGITAESPLGDLDYTLRAFPNHHLALDAMARLHRRDKVERFQNGRYSLSCWFERASRFRPGDGNIPLIHGIHLYSTGNDMGAESEFLEALRLMPESAEAHYNIGLLYVRTRDFPKARQHAKKAYALGYPLPGLREKLRKTGEWDTD